MIQNENKQATASGKGAELDPKVKKFIDEVVVPILVNKLRKECRTEDSTQKAQIKPR